jgi:hypothetical protein
MKQKEIDRLLRQSRADTLKVVTREEHELTSDWVPW